MWLLKGEKMICVHMCSCFWLGKHANPQQSFHVFSSVTTMSLKLKKHPSLKLAGCSCHFGIELEHGLMGYVDKRATALEKKAQARINESVDVKQLSTSAANNLLISFSHLFA
jgi:hypothetical protein